LSYVASQLKLEWLARRWSSTYIVSELGPGEVSLGH